MPIIKNPNIFWNKLEKDSFQYSQTVHYSSQLNATIGLEEELNKVVQLLCSNPAHLALKPFMKLYVDGEPQQIETYLNQENRLLERESLESWGHRVFKESQFTLVLNCIERFSDDIASNFAKLILPRYSISDTDSTAYRITAFIGNSGHSGFGAHLDAEGLDVTHFHLGKESKIMYLWEREQFQKLNNSTYKNCHNFEPYLEKAEKIVIKSGDVLFFPADKYYHVGEYLGFSTAATIGFYQENPNDFLSRAMERWTDDNKNLIPNTILKKRKEKIPADIQTTTVQEIIDEFSWSKSSNQGMFYRPIPKQMMPIFLKTKTIKLIAPFQLLIEENRKGEKALFARGRKCPHELWSTFLPTIEKLNCGKVILGSSINDARLLDFLTWLYSAGSLKLI
jgi:hypothetical protein